MFKFIPNFFRSLIEDFRLIIDHFRPADRFSNYFWNKEQEKRARIESYYRSLETPEFELKKLILSTEGLHPNISSAARSRVSDTLSILSIERQRCFIVPRFIKAARKYIIECLLNENAPYEDKYRDYDEYRYESTNLVDSRSHYEKWVQDCEHEFDYSARLQAAVDFYVGPLIFIDPTLTDKPFGLTEEEFNRVFYLLNFLNDGLTGVEAELFEKGLISNYEKAVSAPAEDNKTIKKFIEFYKPENEIERLKEEPYFTLSTTFDYRSMYYNSSPSSEKLPWFTVMLILLAALVAFIQREKNKN